MTRLAARGVTLSYQDTIVIDDLDLEVPDGRITVLIGPNGCGKSTMIKALARLLLPSGGTVLLDGQDIHRLPSVEVAKRLAVLPQGPTAPDGLTVAQLCRLGRHPHRQAFGRPNPCDLEMVDWALEATGMAALRARAVDTLSGGQRQRAWIAMALGQDTDLLLLDEPTTYLDIAHQIEVLELLRRLNREHGRTIVMVLHDINQAAQYADHLVSIHNGRIHTAGPPRDVCTPEMFTQVFGLACMVTDSPVDGSPLCLPTGLTTVAHSAGIP